MPFDRFQRWRLTSAQHWWLQFALLIVFAALAGVLRSPVMILVWFAVSTVVSVVVSSGLAPPGAHPRSKHSFFMLLTLSAGVAAGVALGAVSLKQTRGIDISLLGVPYFFPLGAAILGAFTASGTIALARIFNVRGVEIRISILSGIATLLFIRVLIVGMDDFSVSEFLFDHTQHVAHSRYNGFHNILIGPASPLELTPFVQVAGFIIGSIFAHARRIFH